MSIRTININLEEQYPRPRTLGFFPDQTPREDDLLLDEVYIAKTNASGAGSIDLPTTSLGTVHYRVEIDGNHVGAMSLATGGPIELQDALNGE